MVPGLTSAIRGLALLDAADGLHRAACREIRIKASPPTYEVTVGSLADLLTGTWTDKAHPLVGEAVNDLSSIHSSDAPAVVKWQKGKARVAQLAAALESSGAELPDATIADLGRLLGVSYRLGKTEISAPLGFAADFTLADRDACHALHNSGVYWIGKHYGEAIDQDKMLQVVKETMLDQGLGRAHAGKKLAEAFGGELHRSESYWTGLAATIATRARSFGAIEAMHASGGRRYEFINPMDEVTSDVCRALDGTTFTVAGGLALRDKLLQAKTPEEWTAISPWPKAHTLFTPEGAELYKAKAFHAEDGTLDKEKAAPYLRKPADLQAGGIAWPPLHFHCRSSIVIRVWYPLDEDGIDPYGDVEPEAYQPPAKKKKPKAPAAIDHVPAPIAPPPWSPSLPSSICPQPFDLDYAEAQRAWRALLRTNGYTDDEIASLLTLEAQPVASSSTGSAEKLADLIFAGDREAIAGVLAKHPPASPRALTAYDWLPTEDALQGHAGAWFEWTKDNGAALPTWYREARAGLHGSDAQKAAALLADADGGKLVGIMGPGRNAQEKIEALTFLEDLAITGDDEALIAAIGTITDEEVVPYGWVELGGKPKAPKVVAKPTPAAPGAPPPTTPIPVQPPAAPPATVVQAADLWGTSEAHAGYDWHPQVSALAPSRPAWRETLRNAGYSDAEEAALWGSPTSAGPLGAARKRLLADAADLGWDEATTAEAARVRFAAELVEHPPASVVGLNGRPAPFLSPDELGARLTTEASSTGVQELGTAYRDTVDGTVWIVDEGAVDEYQARTQVAAAALYRRLGVDAPEARLVRRPDGKLTAAWRNPIGWSHPELQEVADKAGAELASTMPADAWLGNWNAFGLSGQSHVGIREHPIPGLGGRTLRANVRGVFDRRFTGGSKPTGAWRADAVDELATFLDVDKAPRAAEAFALAAQDRSRLLPMMERIGALRDDEIDVALDLAGLTGSERHALHSTLVGRARWMREESLRLRGQIAKEAAARAEEARAAAARAAKAAKRRAEIVERLARGEKVPGYVPEGLDLSALADHLEHKGPAAIAGDHGTVRDQAVMVTRYQMHAGGKLAEDGYELRAKLDSTVFDRVNAQIDGAARAAGKSVGSGFRVWERVIPDDRAFDRGAVIRFNADVPDPFMGAGKHLETDRWSVDFAGYSVDKGIGDKYPSSEGAFRIRVKSKDPIQAERDLRDALRALGLDEVLDAPTDEARRLMLLNKTLWNLQGGGYKAKARGVLQGTAEAEKQLRKLGVDPASIQIEEIPGRGYSTASLPGRWEGYREKDGALYLYHEISNEVGLRGVMGRPGVTGETGGLLATTERHLDGVFAKGASSHADMVKGPGGQHVFTRLIGRESMKVSHSEWYGLFGEHRTIVHPRVLDRVDWYHNKSDLYGELITDRAGADKAIAKYADSGDRGHEIMLRNTISRRDILMWSATTERARDTILAAARTNGVTTWHGYPIEKMVVVQARPGDTRNLDPKNPIHAFVLGLRDDLEGVALDE